MRGDNFLFFETKQDEKIDELLFVRVELFFVREWDQINNLSYWDIYWD